MLKRSEALVLRTTPYGDKRVIVNVYALDEGRLGLIASLSKKSQKGLKPAHFQALQILEIVYQTQGKGDLRALREARIIRPYQELYFDPVKSCLSLFLAELLQKCLNDEEAMPSLYQFLKEATLSLDEAAGGLANFHLLFMIELSRHLGFQPDLNGPGDFFDLMHAEILNQAPHHPHFIDAKELSVWRSLVAQPWSEWSHYQLGSKTMRRQVLENLVQYFRLQMRDFGPLKSLPVLREVLA